MTDLTKAVKKFMEAADCTTDRMNPGQAHLYWRLVAEECGELFHALGDSYFGSELNAVAEAMKKGIGYRNGFSTLTRDQRTEAFDACLDLAWVALGLAYSLGCDVECGVIEVASSNMSKCGPDGKLMRDETGKVIKPAWFKPPVLDVLVK